jgi:hypothetical protein
MLQSKVDQVIVDAGPEEDVRHDAQQEDLQTVPHPQEAPVLQHGGVMRLAEDAADEVVQVAGPGRHRFALQVVVQVGRQAGGRGVTVFGALFQTFEADQFQIGVDAGVE